MWSRICWRTRWQSGWAIIDQPRVGQRYRSIVRERPARLRCSTLRPRPRAEIIGLCDHGVAHVFALPPVAPCGDRPTVAAWLERVSLEVIQPGVFEEMSGRRSTATAILISTTTLSGPSRSSRRRHLLTAIAPQLDVKVCAFCMIPVQPRPVSAASGSGREIPGHMRSFYAGLYPEPVVLARIALLKSEPRLSTRARLTPSKL
jgi:hypothetical protein